MGGRQRAVWLATACIHLGMLLMFAGIALFFMVLPEGVGPSFDRSVFFWIETPAGAGPGRSRLSRRPVPHRTTLCGLRLHALSQPPHRARGLGHRDRLPPTRRTPRERPRGRLMGARAGSCAAIPAPHRGARPCAPRRRGPPTHVLTATPPC
jgi:hypothetical protein